MGNREKIVPGEGMINKQEVDFSEEFAASNAADEIASEKDLPTLRANAADAYEKLRKLSKEEVVQEGMEASVRTVLNTLIAIADVFPGVGEVASWGADGLKVLARIKLRWDRAQAKKRGEDPDKVKMSRIDLTPDVPISAAILTEGLELPSFGVFPSHAIEGTWQLKHDVPRIKKAFERVREELAGDIAEQESDIELAEAIEAFIEREEE